MSEEKPAIAILRDLIAEFTESGQFRAMELVLDKEAADKFVRMRQDPKAFRPGIFEGDWADPEAHPQPERLRVLRVMEGTDGVVRVIGRQGKFLYAAPWLA